MIRIINQVLQEGSYRGMIPLVNGEEQVPRTRTVDVKVRWPGQDMVGPTTVGPRTDTVEQR